MATIKGSFPDYSKHKNLGYFKITADQAFSYTWKPPITWTGFVNNTKVNFVQISDSAIGRSDFDFTDFPQKYDQAISYIIEAIDEGMKEMD